MAVVLSGGGAKGAYEAGALCSVVQKVRNIHVITGASIGAINAAVFAWEYEKTGDLRRAAEAVKTTWLELGELFSLRFCRIALEMFRSFWKTGSPLNLASLADTGTIETKLAELIPKKVRISDIKRIELCINATSLSAGKSVTFSRTNDISLYQAVLASSAIPILFASCLINGAYYVDGGIFNNTPLRDAIAAQATDVFVIELKPKSKDLYLQTIGESGGFNGVYAVGVRLMELVLDKIMYEDLKNARRTNEILAVIEALEKVGDGSGLVEKLRTSIGYKKEGRIKRRINFYEIAPSKRLEPPGTLGFGLREAIAEIISLGESDAKEQLKKEFPDRMAK